MQFALTPKMWSNEKREAHYQTNLGLSKIFVLIQPLFRGIGQKLEKFFRWVFGKLKTPQFPSEIYRTLKHLQASSCNLKSIADILLCDTHHMDKNETLGLIFL